ncbi:MAG TPA: nuclear transport factor 2 family protein [Acidimicrobiales bacterium]|jgi:ketosteroid isomerase-like protein
MTNTDVLRRVFAALGAADVAALDELYTDDHVLELPFAKPDPVRVEGRAAVQEYLRRAFEVFRFELALTAVHELAGGDLVAEYTSEGRVVPTGRPYANTYVGLWRFRDGRVCLTREWYDPVVAAAATADL